MNLGQVRNTIASFVTKDWSPTEFATALHFAQMKYFIAVKDKTDLYQFKVKMGGDNPPLYVVNGVATIPADYYDKLSMTVPIGEHNYPVRVVTSEVFDYLRNSPIEMPVPEYPVCTFQEGTIDFLPKTIQYVNFTYYKTPPQPVFGVKITRGFQEYDPATSTELDWNEEHQVNIIQVMLQYMGIEASTDEIKKRTNN